MADNKSSLVPKRYFPFLDDLDTRINPNWHAAFSKGSLLLVNGDMCESVVLVLHGQIRVYQVSESGRELTLYRVGPGESCVLMLSSVLADKSYPAVAAAETDVIAVTIPVPTFRSWMQTNAGVQQFVYDTLYHRLANVMVLVHKVTFGKMDSRIAGYILERTDEKKVELVVRHEDIALELGTAREVVTRILRHFEKECLITTSKGKITVQNRLVLAARFSDT